MKWLNFGQSLICIISHNFLKLYVPVFLAVCIGVANPSQGLYMHHKNISYDLSSLKSSSIVVLFMF
jgi:hypothetical protein